MPHERITGVITRILLNRGFGFIRDDIDGEHHSWFLHAKEVSVPGVFDTMREGMAVSFVPSFDGTKADKRRAKEIRLC